MNKKQLIVTLILILSVSLSFAEEFNPFPKNTGSSYEYNQNDIPDICFFPSEKARWDGYKVTNKNWSQLTDFQKSMFISEGAKEIERNKNVTADLKDGWSVLIALNETVETMQGKLPDNEIPMVKILLDNLESAGLVKRHNQNK